jgi:hypothetical protein
VIGFFSKLCFDFDKSRNFLFQNFDSQFCCFSFLSEQKRKQNKKRKLIILYHETLTIEKKLTQKHPNEVAIK